MSSIPTNPPNPPSNPPCCSLANLFFRSPALFAIELWGGLALFLAFIIFDTQVRRRLTPSTYTRRIGYGIGYGGRRAPFAPHP